MIHYLNQGFKEGKNPSEIFDGNKYIELYEDVRKAEHNIIRIRITEIILFVFIFLPLCEFIYITFIVSDNRFTFNGLSDGNG